MSNRAHRAQKKVIEEKLEEMIEWYVANSTAKVLPHVCEDKKTYRGITLRWLEPMLPVIANPILIEESLGDSWTLRIQEGYLGSKVSLT